MICFLPFVLDTSVDIKALKQKVKKTQVSVDHSRYSAIIGLTHKILHSLHKIIMNSAVEVAVIDRS